MKTTLALVLGEINRGREMMIFDWDQAAKLIRSYKGQEASAGLDDDWGATSGKIWSKNDIVTEDYTYLASTWATPVIRIDGRTMQCYRMESEVPDWNAKTNWPKSARVILGESSYEKRD